MLEDFINPAKHIQQARLREWSERARADALRREARAIARLRRAVGHGLIALGERIAPPPCDPGMVDTAA